MPRDWLVVVIDGSLFSVNIRRMCDNSSELWFQDGKKTEELHEIQATVDEIVADELVCLFVRTFGEIYINHDISCMYCLQYM